LFRRPRLRCRSSRQHSVNNALRYQTAPVARDLDLTRSVLDRWVRLAKADAGKAPGALTSAEREELSRPRKEVRALRMDRHVLKKAAAFFAKDDR
jgi:transposase